MLFRSYILPFVLLLMTTTCHAQVSDDDKHRLRQDSLRNDYEERIRNEPQKSSSDSLTVAPMMPQMPIVPPSELKPKHPEVSINIMTPAFKTEMQLAYQSHWLEEQRKEQQGGAKMIGVNPLSLIGYVLSKILPHRKSKKEREREKLKQILDNY